MSKVMTNQNKASMYYRSIIISVIFMIMIMILQLVEANSWDQIYFQPAPAIGQKTQVRNINEAEAQLTGLGSWIKQGTKAIITPKSSRFKWIGGVLVEVAGRFFNTTSTTPKS